MHVAVIGTGLIGTSVGLAMRAADAHVTGFDDDVRALAEAEATNAVSAAGSLEEAVRDAELVVVATPVPAVPAAVAAALRGSDAVVTDTASVKRWVLAGVDDLIGGDPSLARRFVGGHPMAGSERSGPGAATPDLFRGAAWVVTPTDDTSGEAVSVVEGAARSMGAIVSRTSAREHDEAMAIVSHLPQIVSYALMNAARNAGSETLDLAASGFRDMTRLASSDAALWADILLANEDALGSVLEDFSDVLESISETLADRERTRLVEHLADAVEARTALADRRGWSP